MLPSAVLFYNETKCVEVVLMQDTVKSPPTMDELRVKRDEILRLAEKRGAFNLRVFGSVARGDAQPDSDIDIMADWREGISIFDMVGLWLDLKELLSRDVDLVDADTLKKRIRPSAMRDAIPL
jgi:predicted nucleotidyltransferase